MKQIFINNSRFALFVCCSFHSQDEKTSEMTRSILFRSPSLPHFSLLDAHLSKEKQEYVFTLSDRNSIDIIITGTGRYTILPLITWLLHNHTMCLRDKVHTPQTRVMNDSWERDNQHFLSFILSVHKQIETTPSYKILLVLLGQTSITHQLMPRKDQHKTKWNKWKEFPLTESDRLE
jgi:hypothetical protein